MSRMRQKRKARGEAARAASLAGAALAEQAGDNLEVVEDDAQATVEGEPASEEQLDAAAEEGEGHEEPDEPDAEADPEVEGASALDPARFKALIEALLFASDKPLTVQRLRQLVRVPDLPRIQAIVDELQADYAERGIGLQEGSGGYQFRTHHGYSRWVQQLVQGRPVRLSRAQLETLALIAYRQPITKPEIDQIRGVDSGGTLKLLLDRTLVRMLGKKEEPGRPLLYGTTREFLDFFSLKDLRELPTLREYSELSEESRVIVDRLSQSAEAAKAAEDQESDSDSDAAS
jgi:segregation and condensation protein B